MSYFDTIRCHACRAPIDPDQLGGRSGMACPHCGTQLDPTDLFGLADAFVGIDEDEGNALSLDDVLTHRRVEDPLAGQDAEFEDLGQPSARAAHAERIANPTGRPIGALEAMREMKKKG